MTSQDVMLGKVSEWWIRTESFLDRSFWARYPKTKSMESMTLDLPDPFGPTIDVKLCQRNGSVTQPDKQ